MKNSWLRLATIVLIGSCAVTQSFALQLVGNATLGKGEMRLQVGTNYLAGLVSPPATFTHLSGVSKAKMYEEYIGITYGLGSLLLEDAEVGIRGTLFQSDEETFGGTTIYSDDQGGYLSLRAAGNLIHRQHGTVGIWLQSDLPVAMELEKFVKPNINYFGAGLIGSYQISPPWVVSQSLFVGSGLGDEKNPNFISNSLGSVNLGSLWWGSDLLLGTGFSLEADIDSRQDALYATALGNGEIQNVVLITPVSLTLPIVNNLAVAGTFAFKWAGQSVRGDQFANLELTYKF